VFVDRAAPPDLYFRVADVDEVAERIRKAGGTAGEKQSSSGGWYAMCSDDQGVRFGITSLRES
jgi:predicted enzyme related to lactoylglutathione lyase